MLRRLCFVLVVAVGISGMAGCQAVPRGQQQQVVRMDTLGFPGVPMSQSAFTPPDRDFVLVLPRGWFFVDLQKQGGSHLLAVATNPEYTLQLVVATVRSMQNLDSIYYQQGIVGVARAEFAQRYRKAGGTLRVVGKFERRKIGLKTIAVYRFTNDQGATVHRVAVFRTRKGNYYSCSLIQSLFAQQALPSEQYCERLFNAVLVTLDVLQ